MKSIFTMICFVLLFGSLDAQIEVGTQGQVRWSYWRNLPDDDFGELYAKEAYPNNPDSSRILYSLQSPANFDDDFASIMRGFIRIPTTESVQFNITGDDETQLWLSTDDQPDNLQLIAHVTGSSGSVEHDKYATQTSPIIDLVSDEYYYFEIHHVEGGGRDHANVWWKTSFTGLTEWNYVSTDYIHDIQETIDICPIRNTPCDDGDSNTINDKEDGFCNCVGQTTTENNCIGQRGSIERYKYMHIPGGTINDLVLNENYPAMPTTGDNLDVLGISYQSDEDSIGTLIEGFLTVPETGIYQFNLTGNSRARFYLSLNEDPAYKTAHQILNINTTNATEHNDDGSQSMIVSLIKGQYYYYELTHKESTGGEHFGIFWKTPFYEDSNWKRIPSFYLYEYDCELACVPDGVPCNDGDIFTNNDQYSNCDCTGTPCSGPDCDSPLANYQPFATCGMTDQLDNRSADSWLSCSKSSSPNSARGSSHWIQYDFGENYEIFNTQVWNYNAQNQGADGFNKVVIDYSADGSSWSQLGSTYTWPLSNSEENYSGFIGPDFNGIGARYVLITSVDSDNISGCRGFGKILFNADSCPGEGIACNDNNEFTYGDIITDCNCNGINTLVNDCETQELNLGSTMLPSDNFSATETVLSANMIQKDSVVSFIAGTDIELNTGFEAMKGAIFLAQIMNCSNMATQKEIAEILKSKSGTYLTVTNIKESNDQIIEFLVPYSGLASLEIYSTEGKLIRSILSTTLDNPGWYRKLIPSKKLNKGLYTVVLKTENDVRKEKMTIL